MAVPGPWELLIFFPFICLWFAVPIGTLIGVVMIYGKVKRIEDILRGGPRP